MGSARAGLLILQGRELVSTKPEILAQHLELGHGGKRLLFSTDAHAGSTSDGDEFVVWPISDAVDVIEGRKADGSTEH